MVCSRHFHPRSFQGVDSHGRPDVWTEGRQGRMTGWAGSGAASLLIPTSFTILYINSLGLLVCLWRDVLLHNHFLCFCCGTGHKEKHFHLELAPLGNPFDFYTTVRPFVCSFVCLSVIGRFDLLTVSAMPILQPPRNEPQRPILLRICFFFYLFFGFVFSEKSKVTYLLLFLSFFLD